MARLSFASMLCALLLAGGTAAGASSPSPRNIVFVLVDDLGWTDLGCYGSSFHLTPTIDAVAQAAVRFTDAYSANPVCSPTRVALLTGRNPARIGITDWIRASSPVGRSPVGGRTTQRLLGPSINNQLPLEEATIARVLSERGYRTGFFGKWHLGGEGYLPEDYGFEVNLGGSKLGQPRSFYSPYKMPGIADGPEGEYLTDRLTSEAMAFIERHAAEPFFVMLSYYNVHTPLHAAPRHHAEAVERSRALPELETLWRPEGAGRTRLRQDRADYASMVGCTDDNVGRLLAHLSGLGLDENTLVVFTSDNGGLSTAPGNWVPTSNEPLRAGKGWCYEGGIRVPLIIRHPGVPERAGSTVSEPVISEDLFPTLLAAVGQELPAGVELDGRSLLPLVEGGVDSLAREALFWHYPHYHGSSWRPGAAIRQGDWKLLEFYDSPRIELYNLREDLGERENLADAHPERAEALRERLRRWQAEIGAAMPVPNPAFAP